MSELRPEELQTHSLPGEAPVIQKTSLAANKQVTLFIRFIIKNGGIARRPDRSTQIKRSLVQVLVMLSAHCENEFLA